MSELKLMNLVPWMFIVLVWGVVFDLKAQPMQIGTNFWARIDWTGELPFKQNVNFSGAWNAGTTDYLVNENVWNEEFLEEIDFYTVLRFMDWLPTNKSPVTSWSQRRLPTEQDQTAKFGASKGVSYEWMIDLCNRTNADIWLCMPHAADDNYCLQLATLVYSNLKPGLKVYVEYSNEVWNFQVQGNYADQEGTKLGISRQEYVAHRSVQMWQIFKSVFGDDFEERVVNTISGQSANSWIAKEQLEYLYSSSNPNGLYPDVYGIAPYFGGNGLDAGVSNIWELLETDIFDHRWDRTDKDSRLDNVIANYNRVKSFDKNIKLIAYEGGQHIQKNAIRVNYHPKMYDLYMKYLEAIDDYILVFAHYVNAGDCSDGNCWGAKEFTGQNMVDAPKYRALYDYYEKYALGTLSNKTERDDLQIYPIPMNNMLNVKSSSADIQSLSLFNLTGEKLYEVKINSPSFEVKIKTEGFNPGLYVLSISRINNVLHRKVLVKL